MLSYSIQFTALRQADAGDIELAGHEFGEQEVAGLGECPVLLFQGFYVFKRRKYCMIERRQRIAVGN